MSRAVLCAERYRGTPHPKLRWKETDNKKVYSYLSYQVLQRKPYGRGD
jgi:hypothetical protein